ncbi:MAG: dihydrodipicolinate synthase family protein [Verrucomicrobia bacterium]|nr:dihydrodipicolinate synthase family protein [Verrucomicrobiota bacterium]
MTETLMRGIFAPVVTAFHQSREIDSDRSIAHCRWLLDHGCDGLVVFGTTSEANSLSLLERKRLLEAIVGSGISPAQLLVGNGACALPDAVDLATHALQIGCGGVLMLPPFYYKAVSVDGLFAFFAEFIDRVADPRLRVYLYHIPPVAQVGIPLTLIEKLSARYGRLVAGIKDSSGDWENTRRLLTEFTEIQVFPGSEAFLLPALRLGAAGCISGTANVGAETMQQLYQNWQTAKAEEIQSKLNRVREIFQRYPIIGAVKAVLAAANDDDSWRYVRPPLSPLSDPDSKVLMRELEGLEFQLPKF